MQSAGEAFGRACRNELGGDAAGKRVAMVCGRGNNGGDGFVAARHLANTGARVDVFLAGDADQLSGDAAAFFAPLRAMSGILSDVIRLIQLSEAGRRNGVAEIVFPDTTDRRCAFGTGFRGPATGVAANLIERMNTARERHKIPVISCDVPSGVNADTGAVEGPAVRATHTITFALPKLGLLLFPGAEYVGRLTVAEIGIPRSLLEEADLRTELTTRAWMRRTLPPRAQGRDANKGTFGTVLVLAGSAGMAGAATLSALSALRAGAGLVQLAVPESVLDAAATLAPEVVTRGLPETGERLHGGAGALEAALALAEKADAVALGPGMGRNTDTALFVQEFVSRLTRPLVVDADGLNLLSDAPQAVRERTAPTVFTPHPGEMGRLLGTDTAAVQADRPGAARRCAHTFNVVALLKGARTLIATPNGDLAVNRLGSPALATAGSGDVLTGVIATLLAQGLSASDAARAGAYLHALAANGRAAKSDRRARWRPTRCIACRKPVRVCTGTKFRTRRSRQTYEVSKVAALGAVRPPAFFASPLRPATGRGSDSVGGRRRYPAGPARRCHVGTRPEQQRRIQQQRAPANAPARRDAPEQQQRRDRNGKQWGRRNGTAPGPNSGAKPARGAAAARGASAQQQPAQRTITLALTRPGNYSAGSSRPSGQSALVSVTPDQQTASVPVPADARQIHVLNAADGTLAVLPVSGTGSGATGAAAGTAATTTITVGPQDFAYLRQLPVSVNGANGRPVRSALLVLTDAKGKRQQSVLTEAEAGKSIFTNVSLGKASVSAAATGANGPKVTQDITSPRTGRRARSGRLDAFWRRADAGRACRFCFSCRRASHAQPLPQPRRPFLTRVSGTRTLGGAPQWIGGVVGLLILGGAAFYGLRAARARGMMVAGTLRRMGVEMPQDAAAAASAAGPLNPATTAAPPPLASLNDLPPATPSVAAAAAGAQQRPRRASHGWLGWPDRRPEPWWRFRCAPCPSRWDAMRSIRLPWRRTAPCRAATRASRRGPTAAAWSSWTLGRATEPTSMACGRMVRARSTPATRCRSAPTGSVSRPERPRRGEQHAALHRRQPTVPLTDRSKQDVHSPPGRRCCGRANRPTTAGARWRCWPACCCWPATATAQTSAPSPRCCPGVGRRRRGFLVLRPSLCFDGRRGRDRPVWRLRGPLAVDGRR
jgi:NAD(P)H-hydrate epimerase